LVPFHRILKGAIASLYSKGTPSRHIAWTLAVHAATVSRHIAAAGPQAAASNQGGVARLPRDPLTIEQQCTLIAFYCQSAPPAGMQRWTLRTAARKINADPSRYLGRTVHPSTIGRVLVRHQQRPHKSSYFLHIRDPMFFEKMHHVLAVYAMKSEYLFCFDECPSIQAISRGGPDVPQDNGSTSREFVYRRNGTTDLFSFLQVCTGRVETYCRASHETATLIEVFTAHVQSQPANEKLHYICDNLFPHFNEDFCKVVAKLCGLPSPSAKALSTGKHRRQWPQREDKRLVIHFLPFHGSWLNQVETWFGLLKRYTLDASWFESVDALIAAIQAFTRTWNEQLAHPFNFHYDGKGLENVVLRRFTRILSQDSEKLKRLGSKFLADLSLLCVRLIDHHRHNISHNDWNALVEAVTDRKPELEAIIAAEAGPKRKPRARKAFGKLSERTREIPKLPQVKLPKTTAAMPATHH
jgi:hypothetical protein